MTWAPILLIAGALAIGLGLAVAYRLVQFHTLEREGSPLYFPGSGELHGSRLLRDVLDGHEYEQLTKRGFLDVGSPSCAQRIYRIPRHLGLVTVFEYGRAVRDICVQPVDPLPSGDVVLMHKLMIQASEEDYLATARQFPPLLPGQRYRPLLPTGSRHSDESPFTVDMSTLA